MSDRPFSHFDETGGISMVDVDSKQPTRREAVAAATVRMSPKTLQKLIDRALPKGDVLTTAKVAGVLGAKQTPALIPLTHPIAITSIDVTFDIDPSSGTIEINSIVRCEGACTCVYLILHPSSFILSHKLPSNRPQNPRIG